MKKTLLIAILAIGAFSVSGCARQVNAPLPAGAINTFDADTNSVLQAAHAFASEMTARVLSTDPSVHIELTSAQKSILVNLNQALNIADPLEIAYHSAPTAANQAALQGAMPAVKSSFTNAQAAIPLAGK